MNKHLDLLVGIGLGVVATLAVVLLTSHLTAHSGVSYSLMQDNGMGGVNRVDYGLTFLDCFERMMPHGTGVTCEVERP